MYRTVEEIISASKQDEIYKIEETRSLIGDFCDALTGFIATAAEWKTAADKAFNLKTEDVKDDFFTARAISLSILTTKLIKTASDVPKLLLSGVIAPTIVNWRYFVETKNTALLIDLDTLGAAGFLWIHHSMIEHSKIDAEGSKRFGDQSKEILKSAGFKYDKREKDPWAIGMDDKKYKNSVDRSKYIWEHRKFPPDFPMDQRVYLANAEQQMIRESNALAHPTLTPVEVFKGKFQAIMLSTVVDTMGVILAYKAAASDTAGWPYTETVGEQFYIYPSEHHEAGMLSRMVMETYNHCLAVFRSQFDLDGRIA